MTISYKSLILIYKSKQYQITIYSLEDKKNKLYWTVFCIQIQDGVLPQLT